MGALTICFFCYLQKAGQRATKAFESELVESSFEFKECVQIAVYILNKSARDVILLTGACVSAGDSDV